MFKSYAVRYGLLACALGMAFAVAYTMLELGEAGRPSAFGQFVAGAGPEYWLVLLMPCAFAGLAYGAGRQRDKVAAYAREREALNEILRTLLQAPDADIEQNLSAAMQVISRTFKMNLAAVLTCERQQWQVRASSAQLPSTLMPLVQEMPWPPLEPRQIMAQVMPASQAADSAPPRRPDTIYFSSVFANHQPKGWLVLLGPASTSLPDDPALLHTMTDEIGAVLTRAHQYAVIRRRARDLEAIAQTNRLLLAGMSLDELLETIVNSAQVRFGLPYVTVMWMDEAAGEFYLRAQAGPLTALALPNFRQKINEGLAAQVLRTGQPYLARDTRETPDYIPAVNAPIRSLLLTPLKTTDQLSGVMTFESQAVDAFSSEEVAALTALSDQAAIAAENAHLLANMQRERQRLGAILHSTRDVVLLMDTDDRVQVLNPAAEQLLGLSVAAAAGRPIAQLLPFPAVLAAYRQNDPGSVEASFETTLDNQLTYLVTITPAKDEAGTPVGRVVIMRDITYLKRLNQFKSQMVQMASHDLRTPLGVALGFLELLREDLLPLTPFRERALQGIEAALNRMQLLVTELLDVERVESGIDQVRTPLDVAGLIAEAVAELAETARAKQQQVTLALQPQLPLVSGDPMWLKQAIGNVINNAVKYTPGGGAIWVRAQRDKQFVLIEVQDTGYGIPASAQANLFQRFFRARLPGTENIEGTGLGLSLVKAVIEQHGGSVSVESEEGRGSIFRLWLPIAEQPSSANAGLLMTNNQHG